MVVNIIGECDKRPVLYTCMKILQNLGDVLLVSSSSRLMRLSDTREIGGHYQNTMIAVTADGIDDFFEDFKYDLSDFEHVIVDNIQITEADITIFVEGMSISAIEKEMLEYIDSYETIQLYKGNMLDSRTLYNLEQFESLRDMCAINQAVAEKVAKCIAKVTGKPAKNYLAMALASSTAAPKKKGLFR